MVYADVKAAFSEFSDAQKSPRKKNDVIKLTTVPPVPAQKTEETPKEDKVPEDEDPRKN